jgi:hypothetical protein
MKNSIDSAAQRIFAKLAGSALIIFATLFGIASITNNSAKADSPNTVNNTGKIQMSTAGFVLNGNPVYNVLVWDTESGKSKLYNFDRGTNKMVAPSYQLPSSPIY